MSIVHQRVLEGSKQLLQRLLALRMPRQASGVSTSWSPTSSGAMASSRKGPRSSKADLTLDSQDRPPLIAALFLIRFDIKAGYVMATESLPVMNRPV
jgi:hypothetical protein